MYIGTDFIFTNVDIDLGKLLRQDLIISDIFEV